MPSARLENSRQSRRLILRLRNEEATLGLGRRLAALIAAGGGGEETPVALHLHGELGAGKTTLARGILRGCGFEGPVKSPTYTLVEPYELDCRRVYHFDLYRISDPGEVDFLGTEEYFSAGSLCIVEWADRGGARIPPADLELELRGTAAVRDCECRPRSDLGAEWVKKLRRDVDTSQRADRF